VELKKLKGELVRTAVSIDTIREIAEVDLGDKGQIKDLNRRRHLSGPYNRKSGLKRELI